MRATGVSTTSEDGEVMVIIGKKGSGIDMRKSRTHGLKATLAAVTCLVAIAAGSGTAQGEVTYDFSFGSSGKGAGQFSAPSGVAINQTTEDVYVADQTANRVEQFDKNGTFIRMWGQEVDLSTNEDICTAVSGHPCGVGGQGTGSGHFDHPRGVAIDQSTGDVYVQDAFNYRIQKFDSSGNFILMWGKEVNATTEGNLCTAASGNTCQAGKKGTDGTPGEFSEWRNVRKQGLLPKFVNELPSIAVDDAGYVYVADPSALPYARVQKFNSNGIFDSQVVSPPSETNSDLGMISPGGVAVSEAGDAFVTEMEGTASFEPAGVIASIKKFDASEFSATGPSGSWSWRIGVAIYRAGQVLAVDPSNQFLFSGDGSQRCADITEPTGFHIVEYTPSGEEVDCTVPTSPALGVDQGLGPGGIAVSGAHKLYAADTLSKVIRVYDVPVAGPPTVEAQSANEITSNSVVLKAGIAANLGETTFHVEYGTEPCSGASCTSTPESDSIGAAYAAKPASKSIEDLEPKTIYYYRFVATNGAGSVYGPDRSFRTYPRPSFDPSCGNNLARQQTGAALLPDCRAFELVSAEDQGGYNVESDLVPGGKPFQGFPLADGKALYAIKDGGIPNSGKPTNRGPDPYIATRDAAAKRWNTEYVGVPADAPSAEPFSSTVAGADSGLGTFAFGGDEICDPCFGDGSAGIPVRKPDGSLVQGMAGSEPVALPVPAGGVQKHLSADGTHFVFSSEQKFEPAGNDETGDVTIYDRNLNTDVTQVVSTLPTSETMQAGDEVAELDISSDGSRIIVATLVGEDEAGNKLWHPYMHIGPNSGSYDLAPGTTTGVLYSGMTDDGTKVFFTSRDKLTGDDNDESADLFRVDVNKEAAVSLTRVSTGEGGTGDTDACDPAFNSYNLDDWNTIPGGPTDCSVVAIGGGSGIAKGDGSVYFLSPELLDGEGLDGAPNIFLARPGDDPRFVGTLESTATEPLGALTPKYKEPLHSFTTPTGIAIDDQDGSTYVLDVNEDFGGGNVFVQKFDSVGNEDTSFAGDSILNGSDGANSLFAGIGFPFIGPTPVPTQIAVDNSSSVNAGDLYVPSPLTGEVRRFSSSGTYEKSISTEGLTPVGIAVDPTNGDLYVGSTEGFILVYSASGSIINFLFASGFPINLAVDSSSNLYEANGSNTTIHFAAGGSEVFDEKPSYGVAYAATTDLIYVDRGNAIVEYNAAGEQQGPPVGGEVLSNSVGLAADVGKIVVSNQGGGDAAVFERVAAPSRGYDSPLVIGSVRSPEADEGGQFQATPDGRYAVVTSVRPLTGFDSEGKYEVFRYDADTGVTDCVSCTTSGLPPSTDGSLASNGLSLINDGRVFFTSGEPLVLRDTDSKKDPYEWSEGVVELVASGQSSFDSGLLTASADGTDVFFFTRDTLAPNDANGSLMKIYDARADGGFLLIPSLPSCAASDECHGPGSQEASAVKIGTLEGRRGNVEARVGCDAGKLARRAQKLSRRAKALRRRAHKASGKRQSALRRQARSAARKANRSRKAARRCRGRTGGSR
jgi:hypothetical protein